MRLPKPVLLSVVLVFALSVFGTLLLVGTVIFSNGEAWDWFTFRGIVGWAAALLGGIAASSALFLLHLHGQESYMSIEKIVLMLCFGFSLSILALLVPMLIF